ncbi:ricin B-like lectin [Infundibulicybe gibba]|nr:ricin B-like lectin [Infundibulicybe gibba]
MPLENGTYRLINAKSGTALDLSNADRRTIAGWAAHDGNNQKWSLERTNEGHWTLRSQETGDFLGVDGNIQDGVPLIAVNHPFNWDIYDDEHGQDYYRLFIPGWPTAINIDLSDHGNSQGGTPITLWGKWEGTNQIWKFERA